MNLEEVVDELNRLMAEELEASLRYLQMRFRLAGPGQGSAAQFFEDATQETLEHAHAIAHQITMLGFVPALRINLTLDGDPIPPEDALAEALEIEQQALEAYREFLPRVSDSPPLAAFIQHQIDVETEHVREILAIVKRASALRVVEPDPGS
ncbi:MAG: ferritin-like domain-containing protein [Acidobacteria bacterium]|nr:ferritin-like domain-containing protein [Acidobacteriota bacterium]